MSVIELQPDKTKDCEVAESLFLRIADITFALVCEPRMMTRIDGTARKFLVEETETDARVRATWGDLSDETGGELIFDSGALWRLYRQESDYVFHFTTPYFGATPYKTARFNDDFSEGEVTLHRPYFADRDGVNPLEYPLDELLMLNLLAQGRGVELHSCGLVDETGAGYLFIGQSGAGKTTTARLWEREPQVRILSDDRIIVRREAGAFWMHGTPWHGEGALALPERAQLKRIFFLKHGERN